MVYLRPRLVFLMVLAALLATLGANSVSLAAPTTLATTLSVTPQNAIPNQRVTLLGSGFTPVATSGGAGPSGAHQITGSGGSHWDGSHELIRTRCLVWARRRSPTPLLPGEKFER